MATNLPGAAHAPATAAPGIDRETDLLNAPAAIQPMDSASWKKTAPGLHDTTAPPPTVGCTVPGEPRSTSSNTNGWPRATVTESAVPSTRQVTLSCRSHVRFETTIVSGEVHHTALLRLGTSRADRSLGTDLSAAVGSGSYPPARPGGAVRGTSG